jgi:hypothetical protein
MKPKLELQNDDDGPIWSAARKLMADRLRSEGASVAKIAQLLSDSLPGPPVTMRAIKERFRSEDEGQDPCSKISHHPSNPWNEKTNAELERYWAYGLTCSEIGSRMNLSRSAVAARARRMGLPGRRDKEKSETISKAASSSAAQIEKPQTIALRGAPKAVPTPATNPAPIFIKTSGKCQFPLWKHGAQPTHRYCEEPALFGFSWCPEHKSRVFVRPRNGSADEIGGGCE